MKSLDIVIVGAGLYVCGKGTSGFGTILPAIGEWARSCRIDVRVHCICHSQKSADNFRQKAQKLESIIGVNLDVTTYSEMDGSEVSAYEVLSKKNGRPTCAIVATPDHLHYQHARECFLGGAHTLIVKPLTVNTHEARDLLSISRAQQLYGAVEFHKRWDRANLVLKNRLKSGELGRPLCCWMEYSQRKSIPSVAFKDWVARSSVIQYLGVHYIDLIRFITGAVPKRVMAVGQKSWLGSLGIDVHDAIQCIVEWGHPDNFSFTQTLLTNWIDPESSSAASDQKLKFVCDGGRFESDQKERGIRVNTDNGGIEHVNPDFSYPYEYVDGKIGWQGYGIDSIVTFLNDICALHRNEAVVKDFEGLRPTLSEGFISTAVVQAAHRSIIDSSNWQKVEEL